MQTPSSCVNCNTTGLPILPVRYTVVPAHISPTLPAGVSATRVKDVTLDTKQYQYALRAMRGGFIYLFYEKGPRGKNYWEALAVSHDGHVTTFIAAPEPPDTIACANINHSVPRTAYFCIENPEKCGKVWIAFTQAMWSNETVEQYKTDAALRAKRMQLIEPAKWINAPQNPHAAEATQANLEQVLEYKPGLSQSALSPNKLGEISKEDGSYETGKLSKQSSLYPATMRNATVDNKGRPITTPESKQTVKLMHQSGRRPDGGSHPPMLLALWDGIGITHELNGYRNEAAGRIKQYGEERELEITALAAIEGAKKALADKAEAWVETKEQITKDPRQLDPDYLRAHAATLPQPQRALRLDDLGYIEQWNAQDVPPAYGKRLNDLIGLYTRSGWQDPKSLPAMVAQRDQARNPIIKEVSDYLRTRDPNKKAAITKARAESWPKYEARLNVGELKAFKSNYEKFLETADKLVDTRTDQLLLWLKADLFLDTLEDYHESNATDGLAFENVIGDAIFGISSSANGAKVISGWSQGAKAERTNILMRALASNQKEGKEALNALLVAAVNASATPLSESSGAIISSVSKHLAKLSEITKKSLSLWNANHKDGVRKVGSNGLNKIFMTANEYLFANKGLTQKVDTLGLAIMRGTVLVRSGAEHAKVMSLLLTEALHAVKAREEVKLMLAMGTAVANKQASNMRQELTGKWKELFKDANLQKAGGAYNEALEMRFGIVTTLLQMVFVTSLMAENSNDPKKQAELLAAKFAMGGGMLDLLATALKGVVGDNARSFQAFKLAGGALSGFAAVVTVGEGIDSATKSWQKERYGVSILYGARSTADLLAGGATLLATISYAAPALEGIGTRYPGSVLARWVAARGASLFAGRAWLLMWGLRLNLLSLAISAAIWFFSDNDLENWLDECTFSKDNPEDRFKSAETQMKKFNQALASVS